MNPDSIVWDPLENTATEAEPVPCWASRLPDDIVIEIVSLIRSDYTKHKHIVKDRHRIFSSEWLPLTHVCRSWRFAAVSYAPFWTDINVAYWDDCQVEEYLSRSKQAPLNIFMVLSSDFKGVRFPPKYPKVLLEQQNYPLEVPGRFALCLGHLYRTRSLTVIVGTRQDWCTELIRYMCTNDAPLLEKLRIDASEDVDCSGPLKLNSRLFNNNTPALHSLDLRSISLGNTLMLRNLKVLVLKFVVIRDGPGLVRVLERNPELERTVIDSVRIIQNSSVEDKGPAEVSLSQLAEVVLRGPPHFSVPIRNALRIPPETQVSLIYTENDPAFFNYLQPHFILNDRLRLYVAISVKNPIFEIQPTDTDIPIDRRTRNAFAMSIRSADQLDPFRGFNLGCIQLLPYGQNIRYLELHIQCFEHDEGGQSRWRSLFSRLPNLETLWLLLDSHKYCSVRVETFFAQLAPASDTEPPIMPKLQELSVVLRRPLGRELANFLSWHLRKRATHIQGCRIHRLRLESFAEKMSDQPLFEEQHEVKETLRLAAGHVECEWFSLDRGNQRERGIIVKKFKHTFMTEKQPGLSRDVWWWTRSFECTYVHV